MQSAAMSESDASTPRVPAKLRAACDNCKVRKTKCDRRTPCASCVTLQVECRTSRGASEKRQRVLLSSKYEEAMIDVQSQLVDVKAVLDTLVRNAKTPSDSTHTSTPSAQLAINEEIPVPSQVNDNFGGDSSFQSQAHRVESVLQSSLTSIGLPHVPVGSQDPGHQSPLTVATDAFSPSLATPSEPHNALPPMDLVLRLLRLAKTEKQRVFVDIPFIDEDEFTAICRGVYFATEPVSLWDWIATNVGLYFLLMSVASENCSKLGTTVDDLRRHADLPMANAEAAVQSLRMCSEPTLESCRAMSMLGTFFVKQGQGTMAWRLFSGASRAALDLGLHRLPDEVDPDDILRKRAVFWHVFIWEKGLSLSQGRTPSIHFHDVTTKSHVPRTSRTLIMYGAFSDYALVSGEVQQTLFSASARHRSLSERAMLVHRFAENLKHIRAAGRSAMTEDGSHNQEMLRPIAFAVEILTSSLLAMIYRLLPTADPLGHPLQCSEECLGTSRYVMTMLINVGTKRLADLDVMGWRMLLNVILSLVPLVSFIALAGNAVATSSADDLQILSSTLSVLRPAAEGSQTVSKILEACERFYRIAEVVVANSQETAVHNEGAMDNGTQRGESLYGFPMAQSDWTEVMLPYADEMGEFDWTALTNIIEPSINTSYGAVANDGAAQM